MDHDDPRLVQEEPADLVRGSPQPPDVEHHEQPAFGDEGVTPGMPAQATDDQVAPSLVFGVHPADADLVGPEGDRRGVLHERRRPSARLLEDQRHRRDEPGRAGDVADAPTRHRIGLRKAVDQDGPSPGVVGTDAAGTWTLPS